MSFRAKTLVGTSLMAGIIWMSAGVCYAQQAAPTQAAPAAAPNPGTARGLSAPIPVNVDVTYQELLVRVDGFNQHQAARKADDG